MHSDYTLLRLESLKLTLMAKEYQINIDYIEAPYNSIWIRDYGANTCYANMVEDVFLVDWIYNRPRPSDDVIPDAYGDYLGMDVLDYRKPKQNYVDKGELDVGW